MSSYVLIVPCCLKFFFFKKKVCVACNIALKFLPLVLRSVFYGFPQPNVSWISNSLNYIVNTESILKLPNISRYSDGVYTCQASNACGSDRKSVDIDVQCESGSTLNCIHSSFHIVSIKGS